MVRRFMVLGAMRGAMVRRLMVRTMGRLVMLGAVVRRLML